jgi:hypothetical protein
VAFPYSDVRERRASGMKLFRTRPRRPGRDELLLIRNVSQALAVLALDSTQDSEARELIPTDDENEYGLFGQAFLV